jgi:hypothetical protein
MTTDDETTPDPLTLWQPVVENPNVLPSKVNYKAKGRVQEWPCYKYANWALGNDAAYVRIRQGYSRDSFVKVPTKADQIGTSEVCNHCSQQFACLAGNVTSLTSRTLLLPPP